MIDGVAKSCTARRSWTFQPFSSSVYIGRTNVTLKSFRSFFLLRCSTEFSILYLVAIFYFMALWSFYATTNFSKERVACRSMIKLKVEAVCRHERFACVYQTSRCHCTIIIQNLQQYWKLKPSYTTDILLIWRNYCLLDYGAMQSGLL